MLPKYVLSMAAVLLTSVAKAEDWTTYGHDAARSHVTRERLKLPLAELWTFQTRHRPQPAWGDPKAGPVEKLLELRRVHFDDVFQPVVAAGAVLFGSSAENKVFCLDLSTGRIRWTHLVGGPVRLAPGVAEGRVYFGCDDGYVYCLGAGDGAERWKFRAAPEDRRVLGHGKLISLWPVRTDVLVAGGVAYFGAGIFPAEGVFLYAVDAGDGHKLWCNDTCGEPPKSRISPQGYLLASESALHVPMGRVSPAAFDRQTGRLLRENYFGKTVGGTFALLAGDQVFTGTEEIQAYHEQTRVRSARYAARRAVVTDEVAYLATGEDLLAVARRQPPDEPPLWKTESKCCEVLILAGDVLFAGGAEQVTAIEAASGKVRWTCRLEGTAKGLAAAAGRLLVSTDKGFLYCFGPPGAAKHAPRSEKTDANPFARAKGSGTLQHAAEAILKESGVRRGHCLVLGLETGQLALELARRSELMVCAVSPDAQKVAAARKAMDAAGLYGARVLVEQWPLDRVPYADYFANLIVSETALVTGQPPLGLQEAFRMLKPCGGVMMTGRPCGAGVSPAGAAGAAAPHAAGTGARAAGAAAPHAAETWLRESKVTRGALAGAGTWTHQYADPGNTACSSDALAKAPLGVLWFGHPGPEHMVNRHVRPAGPLCLDGRLFVQGENCLMAYDAYNGVKLWQHDIPGAMRITLSHDSSNLAVGAQGLFAAVGDKCLRLDPATGQTKATYQAPDGSDGKPGLWGYVACSGDLLFGTRTTDKRHGDRLFAFDVRTGSLRWCHPGNRIPHNAIAIGDGNVFLVSADVTAEQRRHALGKKDDRWQDGAAPEGDSPIFGPTLRVVARKSGQSPNGGAAPAADVRLVVALDARTGRVRWQKAVDLTDCGATAGKYGVLASMYHDGVLALFGLFLDGHNWQDFFRGQYAWRRITALSGKEGSLLWSRPVGFRVRPVIVGKTLHAEPWAFDLHTGQQQVRTNPVTGQVEPWQFSRPGHHCGCPVASAGCLFFRSYEMGYYDLMGDYGTMHFGGQRPGCWVNCIPAAGLVLMPEASAGCLCPFPNQCTVAFQPAQQNKAWAYFSSSGPLAPVAHLAINLGAPGDRKDAAGTLWLGYPRPTGSLMMKYALETSFLRGGGFVQHNSVYPEIEGTTTPWLYGSAARGLARCAVPLLGSGDGAALYRVRLAMADPDNDRPGVRVFDIKLQGKLVEEAFDPAAAAGGRNRAIVKEYRDVMVRDKLAIELVPQVAQPAAQQWPILYGVEIIRQRFTGIGCTPPELTLSTLSARRAGELALSNLCDEPFEGTLAVSAPKGLTVAAGQTRVKLAVGQRATIPIEARIQPDAAAGIHPVAVKLLRADGSLELERTMRVEHLGHRERAVFQAVEDAYVQKRNADRNFGSSGVLLVSGGEKTMGDAEHSIAYLKFRIDVRGRPVGLRLRLHNAGQGADDSGRICLATGDWKQKEVTYDNRPRAGKEVGRLGRVAEFQVVECPLGHSAQRGEELSLAIDPTSCEAVDYESREGRHPPELIVEYEPDSPDADRSHAP